jgi:hypothetical protein
VNADAADAVAGVLYEAIGRHCTVETLIAWQLGLADLPDHTLAGGASLAEHVAVLLARSATEFVTLAEFRAAYLARLPRSPSPNRSDLPELECVTGDRPASSAGWLARCREQLDRARGPLASGLKQVVTVPRADEPYFDDPEPEP